MILVEMINRLELGYLLKNELISFAEKLFIQREEGEKESKYAHCCLFKGFFMVMFTMRLCHKC